MRRRRLRNSGLWLCLLACAPHPTTRATRATPAAVAPRPTEPAPLPASAPHGGKIRLVALTDRGDAAITSDELGELRLWPTLDGAREPVIVDGARPVQLALGRDGAGLVAAILDQAGNVELRGFDPVGRPRGQVQLPGGAGILQVALIDGGALVRRADHSIERYDLHGAPRGRLVAEPGQRVVELAVRRDHAIAGLATDAGVLASVVRPIILTGADPGALTDAQPGALTGADPGELANAQPGAGVDPGALTGALTGAPPGALTGAHPGALTDAHPGALTGADPGELANAHPGAHPGALSGAPPGGPAAHALAWGPPIPLPRPLVSLALAPGGRRLAGSTAVPPFEPEVTAGPAVLIVSLTGGVLGTIPFRPARVRLRRAGRVDPDGSPPMLGFVSDDQLIASYHDELRWAMPAAPSWRTEAGEPPAGAVLAATDTAAFADDAALRLVTPAVERTLGYRWTAPIDPVRPFRAGHGILADLDGWRLWLDDELAPRPPTGDPDRPSPELLLDDDHAVFVTPLPGSSRQARVALRALRTAEGLDIVTAEDVTSVQYDPPTRVLAVQLAGTILRYRISRAPLAATPLRALAATGDRAPFVLTDPARADGAVAVVIRDRAGKARTYRLDQLDVDAPGALLAGEAFEVRGEIQAVDRQASIYVMASKPGATPLEPDRDELEVYARGRTTSVRAASATAADRGVTAISHDGRRFASTAGDLVTVYDATGAVRWSRAAWQAGPAAFTDDDAGLVVALRGGALLALDTRTGAQRALRCGWGFGLFAGRAAEPTHMPSPCDSAVRHGDR